MTQTTWATKPKTVSLWPFMRGLLPCTGAKGNSKSQHGFLLSSAALFNILGGYESRNSSQEVQYVPLSNLVLKSLQIVEKRGKHYLLLWAGIYLWVTKWWMNCILFFIRVCFLLFNKRHASISSIIKYIYMYIYILNLETCKNLRKELFLPSQYGVGLGLGHKSTCKEYLPC